MGGYIYQLVGKAILIKMFNFILDYVKEKKESTTTYKLHL